MLIKFSSRFTYKKLRELCRINNIKYINKFNKIQLLTIINNHKIISYIQRHFRKKLMKTNICVISFEKIKYPFISIKVNGFFFYYDFNNFITYLNKSEMFKDPCTRSDITDKKIMEINKLILYYYGTNTTKIIISPTMKLDVELNIITYCMYDIITELNRVEPIGVIDLYSNILPRIIYYAQFLVQNHSRENSDMVLKACVQSITSKIPLAELIKDYLLRKLSFRDL